MTQHDATVASIDPNKHGEFCWHLIELVRSAAPRTGSAAGGEDFADPSLMINVLELLEHMRRNYPDELYPLYRGAFSASPSPSSRRFGRPPHQPPHPPNLHPFRHSSLHDTCHGPAQGSALGRRGLQGDLSRERFGNSWERFRWPWEPL